MKTGPEQKCQPLKAGCTSRKRGARHGNGLGGGHAGLLSSWHVARRAEGPWARGGSLSPAPACLQRAGGGLTAWPCPGAQASPALALGQTGSRGCGGSTLGYPTALQGAPAPGCVA